jgi:hypothetical protein
MKASEKSVDYSIRISENGGNDSSVTCIVSYQLQYITSQEKQFIIVNSHDAFTSPRTSGVPSNFVRGRGDSTNSVEERAERSGIWGGSPLDRGSAQFANE